MSPEEMRLDMLVAELDYENRLLRARNERLEREAEQRKPWVGLTQQEQASILASVPTVPFEGDWHLALFTAIEAILREKNQ